MTCPLDAMPGDLTDSYDWTEGDGVTIDEAGDAVLRDAA